jgi:hypothetical protein
MKAWFNACIENLKNIFRGSSVNPSAALAFHELSTAPMNIREVTESKDIPAQKAIPYEITAVPSIFELAAASHASEVASQASEVASQASKAASQASEAASHVGGPPSPLDLTADAHPSEETYQNESLLPGSVPLDSGIIVEDVPTSISQENMDVIEAQVEQVEEDTPS